MSTLTIQIDDHSITMIEAVADAMIQLLSQSIQRQLKQ